MGKPKNFTNISGKKYDGMMGRCYRPTETSYKSYGARGIKVCSAWIKNMSNFRSWLLEELQRIGITTEEFSENAKKWQIDRINSDGDYTPENCRIVDSHTNQRNKTTRKKMVVISAEGETIEI